MTRRVSFWPDLYYICINKSLPNSTSIQSQTQVTMKARILFLISLFFQGALFAQWNTNTSVNMLISGLPVADMQSVATSDGKMWVAYYHENAGNYDMRAQLIDADGYLQLGPNGVLVSNQTSGSATYVFNVCLDNDDNLVIGFQYEAGSDMNAVLHKISPTGVQLWGASGVVIGQGLAPYPATLTTGETVVVWNESQTNTLNMQKITTAGSLAWSSPVQIKVGSANTTRGQVITNTNGKYTVVYQKSGVGINSTLYAQHFNASGTALYPPLQICNEATSAARYYSIASEGDTAFFGYYSSVGLRFNSYLQRINPDGTLPWGVNGAHFNTSTSSGDPYQGPTVIAHTPGVPHIWAIATFSNPNQTQYGVYVQKFLKGSGARQFGDGAKMVYPISSTRDVQAGEIVLVNDEPMFMSYNATDIIYATRLDASGNFAWPGNRVELSSTTAPAGSPKMRYGFTAEGPNRCAGIWTEKRENVYMGYAQGISVGGLIGIDVTTQGGVPAVITANGGSLQMVAAIFPASASQDVVWSIVPGTGQAGISASGLVTAQSNGTVWARAEAVQDPTMADSLLITISGQTVVNPVIATLPATGVSNGSATLNGEAIANTFPTDMSFEWGTSIGYGNTIAASPSQVAGTTPVSVNASLTGLNTGITYNYRCVGTNTAGTFTGANETFMLLVGQDELPASRWTISPNPSLGKFQLAGSGLTGKSIFVEVFNSTGRKVFEGKSLIHQGTISFSIDLKDLPAGIYLVVIKTEEGIKFQITPLLKH